MIKIFTFGGLGNQMFQYAAARALAEQLGTSVCIDKSFLNIYSKNTTPRCFELDSFCRKPDENTTSSKNRGRLFLKIYPKIKGNLLGRKIAKNYNLYEEKQEFNFDSNFLSLPDKTLLLGYFQSEKYFAQLQEIIRDCFTFKKPISGKNAEIAEKINSTNAVSIHIRRGDYVSNAKSMNIYAQNSSEYYEKAINHIRQQVENPVFFVFSDDPEEAKKIISTPGTTFIDWNNGQNSYLDMQLMSLCKHNIIANSSFSWWGAWLNKSAEKVVIAPANWFNDENKNSQTIDLIPEKWIRM